MAKKQSRRSISVRGVTYNQLREYCSRINLSMSDFLEQRVADYFTQHNVTFTMPGTQPSKRRGSARTFCPWQRWHGSS